MHTWAEPPDVFRDNGLRELVDELPPNQCHLVSRVFFGGAPLAHAAEEAGLAVPTARALLASALEVLRVALSEED